MTRGTMSLFSDMLIVVTDNRHGTDDYSSVVCVYHVAGVLDYGATFIANISTHRTNSSIIMLISHYRRHRFWFSSH